MKELRIKPSQLSTKLKLNLKLSLAIQKKPLHLIVYPYSNMIKMITHLLIFKIFHLYSLYLDSCSLGHSEFGKYTFHVSNDNVTQQSCAILDRNRWILYHIVLIQ